MNAATKEDLKIKIKYWQEGGTNFTSMLFTLIAKADHENRERLRVAFPDVVEAWESWQASPGGEW